MCWNQRRKAQQPPHLTVVSAKLAARLAATAGAVYQLTLMSGHPTNSDTAAPRAPQRA